MAQNEGSKHPLPPYLPYRTFTTYLDGLRVFVPQVIDRSTMRSFSGAIQSWLLSGLRYLNLIDGDGVPQPRLHRLAAASAEERKPLLRHLIDAEYGFLKGIDLPRATPRQIDAAFEQIGAQGDTVRKCVAFFLAMAKDAEVPLSPLLLKSHRRAGARQNGSKRQPGVPAQRTATVPPAAAPPTAPVTPQTTSQLLLEILDPESMSEDEQSAVWTLLKYLRKTSR